LHSWQSYVCRVAERSAGRSRNEIMARLQERGISTRPGTHAVHLLGYYRQRFGLRPDDYPNARDCDHQTLAIPLHNQMTEDDYAYVVDVLHEIGAPQSRGAQASSPRLTRINE
jgi:dTDP-4-amino-4,6-dideoxygalactose transaminase